MRQDEKITFYNFLILYYGSSFILMLIISILIYKIQYQLNFDLSISKMQNHASFISSKIVHSHMQENPLNYKDIILDKEYTFALYDKSGRKIYGNNIDETIDFSKNSYIDNNRLYVVDKSAFGHLGVYFVVLKEDKFRENADTFKVKIFAGFIVIYMIVCIIGYFLAKLLIRPIRLERERLDRFIKDSAHELNTPVSALMMCTEQLCDIDKDKNLERINLSAKRISDIYKDMRYLFLDNNTHVAKGKISLENIVYRQIEYIKPLADKKNITIKVNLKKKEFLVDEESFERVMNNLLSNAVKYNKIGGTIEVSLSEESLIVRDSGIGIEKDKLKDIFIRYNRNTNIAGGFGIGLDIVFTVCKKYNITIDVQSQIGTGSSFILKFN